MTSANTRTDRRAPRNRTLSLTAAEKDFYRRQLRDVAAATKPKLQVICGDAFHVLEKLPPASFDLLFADPPYNLTKRFGAEKFRRTDDDAYEAWLESWLRLCVPLMKPAASVYICGDWRSSSAIQRAGSRFLKLRNRITWEREKGRGARSNWKNSAEDIWFFTVSDVYTFNLDAVKIKRKVLAPYKENGRPKDWNSDTEGNFRLTHPSNIWTDITVPFWSMPENTNHPAQKPEKLLAKLILSGTNANDLILDPFAGCGTTAVAAQKLGRRCTAIEIDEDYCLLALKRLELARANTKIQGYEDGVFLERNAQTDSRVRKRGCP